VTGITREDWRAALRQMSPEQVRSALEAGTLNGLLRGDVADDPAGAGADQGAMGRRYPTMRAELAGLSDAEVLRRLNAGDYDGMLRGDR
jgi:hypothetical protein